MSLRYPHDTICALRDFANEGAAMSKTETERARLSALAVKLAEEAKAVAPTDRPPPMPPVTRDLIAADESGIVDDVSHGHDPLIHDVRSMLRAS